MTAKNTSSRRLFEVLFRHFPGGTWENHEALTQASWSQGWDLKPGFPEETAGQPNFCPKLSVMNVPIKVTDPDETYIWCNILDKKRNFWDVKHNFIHPSHTVRTALDWYTPPVSVGLPVPNFIKSVK